MHGIQVSVLYLYRLHWDLTGSLSFGHIPTYSAPVLPPDFLQCHLLIWRHTGLWVTEESGSCASPARILDWPIAATSCIRSLNKQWLVNSCYPDVAFSWVGQQKTPDVTKCNTLMQHGKQWTSHMDQLVSMSYRNNDRNHNFSMDIIVYTVEYGSIARQVNYSRYLVLLCCFSNGFFCISPSKIRSLGWSTSGHAQMCAFLSKAIFINGTGRSGCNCRI
jgi:hypothetical protein